MSRARVGPKAAALARLASARALRKKRSLPPGSALPVARRRWVEAARRSSVQNRRPKAPLPSGLRHAAPVLKRAWPAKSSPPSGAQSLLAVAPSPPLLPPGKPDFRFGRPLPAFALGPLPAEADCVPLGGRRSMAAARESSPPKRFGPAMTPASRLRRSAGRARAAEAALARSQHRSAARWLTRQNRSPGWALADRVRPVPRSLCSAFPKVALLGRPKPPRFRFRGSAGRCPPRPKPP